MKNKNYFNLEIILLFRLNKSLINALTMSSNMSQSVQHIIDANAPMVFTYAHSRPEFQRIVYPIGIVGDVVHTLDAETNKFKKFKLDGIIFPTYRASAEYLSYAIEQGFTISLYYRNSTPEFKRVGVPVKLSKNGKSVLVRLETYLPYRRYSNQIPTYTEYKYFTIDAMENLQSEHYVQTLPTKVEVERDWFPIEETNIDEEEPIEVEFIEREELHVKFSSDDERETTDEMPSSDDDEKSCSDYEETCTGCKYGIANQQAHYGGCLEYEEY